MERLHYFLILFLFSIFTLNAEKAWDDGYRPYQDVAPEYLEIKIIKVQLNDGGALFGSASKVVLQAEVAQVFRSSTGLQPGNSILITYKRKSEAGPLVLQPSIPKEGSTVPAFLRKKSPGYEPAALHHSFEPLTSQQLTALGKSAALKPAPKKTALTETKNKPETEAPPQLIVTAPEPGAPPMAEPVIQLTDTEKPTPTPTPEVKTKNKKQPKVTRPIVVVETEKKTPSSESTVIADPLPDRKPEPIPAPLAEPIAQMEVATPSPEPLVIKKIEPKPEPVENIQPTAKAKPKTEQVAPPLITSSQPPAAVAPPAPASSSFDQEGLTAYAAIYAKIKEGDKAVDSKETENAIKIYKDILQDLDKLKTSKPDFQPFIVEYRQRDLTRKIAALESSLKK
jgi:hypothetical protein